MRIPSLSALVPRGPASGLLAVSACWLMLLCAAQAQGATQTTTPAGQPVGAGPVPSVAATLAQCVSATSAPQSERSATFSGEMTALPDSVRMAMRIDLQERLPGEELFHTVSAPGLGVWRSSEKKVKVYKSLQQVTNLSSPAVYRAVISFRWLNAKGHVTRHTERFTRRCAQPAVRPTVPPLTETSPPSSTEPTPVA